MEKNWYSIFDMDEREQSNFSIKRQLLCICIIAIRPGHSGRRVGFGSGPFGSGSFGSKSLGPDRVISNFRFRVGSGRAGSGSDRVLDS